MKSDCPIIDCHCHVYPDKIAEKAVEGIGKFYDIDMDNDGSLDGLISCGSKIGVKHYLIFSVATTPKQVNSINRFIADTAKKSGGLITGLGTLHPDSENIESDIDEIASLGLKGVKMHPDFQKFRIDDEKCDVIYRYCEGRLPILFHTGDTRFDYSNPERMKPVLDKYPDLTVIGAHFGGWSCWCKAAEMLSSYPNFYVDCSSTFNWLEPCEVRKLVEIYGADKVLFGVDYPMWTHETEFEKFIEMGLSPEDKEKILYKNAMKLFNIEL